MIISGRYIFPLFFLTLTIAGCPSKKKGGGSADNMPPQVKPLPPEDCADPSELKVTWDYAKITRGVPVRAILEHGFYPNDYSEYVEVDAEPQEFVVPEVKRGIAHFFLLTVITSTNNRFRSKELRLAPLPCEDLKKERLEDPYLPDENLGTFKWN